MSNLRFLLVILPVFIVGCSTHDPADDQRDWITVVGNPASGGDPGGPGDPGPSDGFLTCYLNTIEQTQNGNVVNDYYRDYEFTYNTSGWVTSATFSQNQNPGLQEVDIEFTYESDLVTVTETDPQNQDEVVWEEEYFFAAGSELAETRIAFFTDPMDQSERELTEDYFYDGEGFLIRIEVAQFIDPDEPSEMLEFERTVTYTRNGLTVEKVITDELSSNVIQRITYTFSSIANPFEYDFAEHIDHYGFSGLIHPNLPAERNVTQTSAELGPAANQTWTWVTDNNGVPVSYTGEDPNGTVQNTLEYSGELRVDESCD